MAALRVGTMRAAIDLDDQAGANAIAFYRRPLPRRTPRDVPCAVEVDYRVQLFGTFAEYVSKFADKGLAARQDPTHARVPESAPSARYAGTSPTC
jgi:hypothetical protein